MEALLIKAVVSAQFIIMLSLGIGLEIADFKRVFTRKFTFLVAITCQLLLLPIMAFGIIKLFDFPGIFAAGLMLLSFCPGGVSSNVITKLSRGDVALSVSLTAVVSVLSFATIPLLTTWAINHFMGAEAIAVSFFQLAAITFAITTLPVSIGVLIRHRKPDFANAIEHKLEIIAVALWVIIVVAAIAKTFDKLMENFLQIGGGLLLLPLIMVLLSIIIGRLMQLTVAESKTLSVETSIQNAPMAMTLGATISGGVGMGITELALPAAVYSVTMYLIAIPAIFIFRRWSDHSCTAAVYGRLSLRK